MLMRPAILHRDAEQSETSPATGARSIRLQKNALNGSNISILRGYESLISAFRIPHSTFCNCDKREAEVGKPKSNWELQELLGLTALIMDSWKGDNRYEKPGIIRKKAPCPFLVQLASCFRTYVPFFSALGKRKFIDFGLKVSITI